uniref:UBC core domain-containing protein n=1 Tax=Kalmanozyma brasiliensis (strain GHG001) TaxID=1365824 RepID=V5GJ27_KALBG
MVSPTTVKALLRELTSLQRNPPADIRVALSEADILSFSGWILGPPSTPYAGGFFRVTFNFDGVDFPNAPPICRFATPIFHPNVSRSGEICVSSLKKDWKREYGIERILVTIRCLLVEPNPDSALDAEASRLMQEDWATYEETARLWTSVHAEKRPACFEEDKAEQGRVAASEPARPQIRLSST